ncbi:MAG: DUF4166 domain-containing protein [Sulfuricella sp.]|nr:DUF4166 domain-containing protein [Sulfuricella sp.]
MNETSVMQRALGPAWNELPAALRAHYQYAENVDEGLLDIDYPRHLHPVMNVLHALGALVNRRGRNVPTRVEKHMGGTMQFWSRTLRFPDGKTVLFNSRWVHDRDSRLIEYVNPFLGLRMKVWIEAGTLHYESVDYVLQLGGWRLSLPEWLLLGKAHITEAALDERKFAMDFYLHHPLFGRIFSYAGQFETHG